MECSFSIMYFRIVLCVYQVKNSLPKLAVSQRNKLILNEIVLIKKAMNSHTFTMSRRL